MKLIYLFGNIFMVLLSLCSTFLVMCLEYCWVTDASMTHTGVKYAGGALCFVCLLLVVATTRELVLTIKGKED